MSAGGRAVRGKRGERDPLTAVGAARRWLSAGRRSSHSKDRGACVLHPARNRATAGPDAGGTARDAGGARGGHQHRHTVALLRPAWDHAQRKAGYATEQDRRDILKRREDRFDSQLAFDRRVFINETSASAGAGFGPDQHGPPHGRWCRGERLRAGIPFGHWKPTTFVAGLRRTDLVAPWVLDGPMNAEASSPTSPAFSCPNPHAATW